MRVLVADDHPLFRRGIGRAIEYRAELTFAGEHADGESALAAIRETRPDIALLDVRMPKLSGIEVLEAVVGEDLPTRIVLLSGYPDPDAVYRALTAGAAGFLAKSAPGSEICERLVAVSRGETVLAPEVQSELAGQLRNRAQAAVPARARDPRADRRRRARARHRSPARTEPRHRAHPPPAPLREAGRVRPCRRRGRGDAPGHARLESRPSFRFPEAPSREEPA